MKGMRLSCKGVVGVVGVIGVEIAILEFDHGDWGPFDTIFSQWSGWVQLGNVLGWKGDAHLASRW